jgi:hypothetical protein
MENIEGDLYGGDIDIKKLIEDETFGGKPKKTKAKKEKKNKKGGSPSFAGVQTHGSLTEAYPYQLTPTPVQGGEVDLGTIYRMGGGAGDKKKKIYFLLIDNKTEKNILKKNKLPYKFSGGDVDGPNPSSAAKKAAKVQINPLIAKGQKSGEIELSLRRASYGRGHSKIYKYKIIWKIVPASDWMKKKTGRKTSVQKKTISLN